MDCAITITVVMIVHELGGNLAGICKISVLNHQLERPKGRCQFREAIENEHDESKFQSLVSSAKDLRLAREKKMRCKATGYVVKIAIQARVNCQRLDVIGRSAAKQ
jgi:hypothetical protein